MDFVDEKDELYHYGIKFRSGRYPWGSGKEPYQHSGDFLSRVEELKSKGLSEKEIAEEMGLTTTKLRIQKGLAADERREILVNQAKNLLEKGYSRSEVARQMGFKHESSIRTLLDPKSEARMMEAEKTFEFLRDQIDEYGAIEVGQGVERELNISRIKFDQALYMLEMDGYSVFTNHFRQATNPNQYTPVKIAAPPGTEKKDIRGYDNIHYINDYISTDNGQSFTTFKYPESMDSKRLAIRYAEEGGTERDGLIELRRGVKDLSLGNSNYSQVRILVDGTHYLKGMAVYSDDLPDGVDIRFNTNKHAGTPACGPDGNTVLKNINTDNPKNPFGSLIMKGGQSTYIGDDGEEHLSLINKRADEGDWDGWSKKLPSQFLSKQPAPLIKKQLDLAVYDTLEEYEALSKLTNPTVRKVMLNKFADSCDTDAVDLQAAALPRQRYQVILPIPEVKDNEIYAPNFNDGEEVVLVRFPHGGLFEIPKLKVNNKVSEAQNIIGRNPMDAVGINSKVAARLSGADFDGDTVMVIPMPKSKNAKIKTSEPLDGLEGFDPSMEYPYHPGMTTMKKSGVQAAMGSISNLITDMTIKGAPDEDLAKAVRHSMVVIDAYKHKLDYKQSAIDNDIQHLKEKYQGHINPKTGRMNYGANTLISKASATTYLDKQVGSPKVNIKGKPWYDPNRPEGVYIYTREKEYYTDYKTGKQKERTSTSTNMADTDDAHTLSSGYIQEEYYAEYANRMKAMANKARKEAYFIPQKQTTKEAKEKYAKERDELMGQLNEAELNKPRERKAQMMTSSKIRAIKQDNPELYEESHKGQLKKIKQQYLEESRAAVGAKRISIDITPEQWEAIQAGAISATSLTKIMNYADIDKIKEYASPKPKNELSDAKINLAKNMASSGYITSEIAQRLGVSDSTVRKCLKKSDNGKE